MATSLGEQCTFSAEYYIPFGRFSWKFTPCT